jgi:hypothetical protein
MPTFVIVSRWFFRRMKNVSDKRCWEVETHVLCSVTFFRKSCPLWDSLEKYCRTGQATDDNMAHADCMPDNEGNTHTHTHTVYVIVLSFWKLRVRARKRAVTFFITVSTLWSFLNLWVVFTSGNRKCQLARGQVNKADGCCPPHRDSPGNCTLSWHCGAERISCVLPEIAVSLSKSVSITFLDTCVEFTIHFLSVGHRLFRGPE